MNKTFKQLAQSILACSLIILSACKGPQAAMIIGANYDNKKNETILTLLPYGNIVFPGKWTKTGYDRVSRQHYFKNSDSTTISATKNPRQQYPFYQGNPSDKEFVVAFVKWDAAYWSQKGTSVKIMEDRSDNGYKIWQVTDSNKAYVNTIFLYGSKNGFAYNFSGSSNTWTEERIKDFLIMLFNNN